MGINLIGALGVIGLTFCGAGFVLYAALWIVRNIRRGPEIF